MPTGAESGLLSGPVELRDEYSDYDSRRKYNIPEFKTEYKTACRCGEVLQGKITPEDCPLFGKACNPEHPVGACMVSGEAHVQRFIYMEANYGDMVTLAHGGGGSRRAS